MANNFNNLIEKYILGKLKGRRLFDFKREIELSPELAFEVQFSQEMAAAITETDVMELRSSLHRIFQPVAKVTSPINLFDLSQNLDQSKIAKTANAEIKGIENSLQFIHLENHKKNISERVHIIKTDKPNVGHQTEKLISDDELWKEISISLQENDIIELRNSLKQITNQKEIAFTDFEIDQYLDHEFSEKLMQEMDNIIAENNQLAAQVNLHKMINDAINENDISGLRSTLNSIIAEEQTISYNEIKRIDEYLLNYLNNGEYLELEEQLIEDSRLKSELELNSEINQSIMEKEVMNLRNSLSSIFKEEKGESKIRQFVPASLKKSPSRIIGVAASIAAVISVGAISLSQQRMSSQEIYRKVYRPYEATGLYRSSSSNAPEIFGVDLYNEQKYSQALDQFSKVLASNPDHPMCNFYTGLSYQQLNKFDPAIHSYQKVIDEKDNLFIEQAEWYMALCYLKTDESMKAYTILNQIINKNGYYQNNAKEVIKKLK